jgi:hypothetical protein
MSECCRLLRIGNRAEQSMPRKCEVVACEKPVHAMDMCRVHYQRVFRTGSINGSGRTLPVIEKFWARVDKSPGDGCWIWRPGPNGKYGKIDRGVRAGGQIMVHRFSYELHHGQIPDGTLVCHRCDTPKCVNPDHLFLGTHKDNTNDMDAKGRSRRVVSRGERHPRVKLSGDDVVAIRSRSSESLADLSREYGVTPQAIYRIRNRLVWTHI